MGSAQYVESLVKSEVLSTASASTPTTTPVVTTTTATTTSSASTTDKSEMSVELVIAPPPDEPLNAAPRATQNFVEDAQSAIKKLTAAIEMAKAGELTIFEPTTAADFLKQ